MVECLSLHCHHIVTSTRNYPRIFHDTVGDQKTKPCQGLRTEKNIPGQLKKSIRNYFIWSPEEAARNLVHDQAYAERAIAAAAALSEAGADRALVNRYAAARLAWEPRWFNPALERWLHRIKVPALVLWGAEDRLLPARYAEVWRAEVPGATVEIIPACGHLMHVEKPEEVANKILAFTAGDGT